MNKQNTKKIVLIGPSNVGKTSFVHKCKWGTNPKSENTLGVISTYFAFSINEETTYLNLSDCGGRANQQGNEEMRYCGADAAIYMYSCDDPDSYSQHTMISYVSKFKDLHPKAKVFVVGNKMEYSCEDSCEYSCEDSCIAFSDFKISAQKDSREHLIDVLAKCIAEITSKP